MRFKIFVMGEFRLKIKENLFIFYIDLPLHDKSKYLIEWFTNHACILICRNGSETDAFQSVLIFHKLC